MEMWLAAGEVVRRREESVRRSQKEKTFSIEDDFQRKTSSIENKMIIFVNENQFKRHYDGKRDHSQNHT